MERGRVVVVGGGPVGCTLALTLAARGFQPEIYERRPDPRRVDQAAGRSINLVLTLRGLDALGRVGQREAAERLTVPVLGRMMHSLDGELAWQPYGKDATECNYSISRGALNELLLTAAEEAGVPIRFGHRLVDGDLEAGRLVFEVEGGHEEVEAPVVFGADGAPSGVREVLVQRHGGQARVDMLGWGYKELLFPATEEGGYAMASYALHIWPRGHHMLMGLANLDGSFTGTLYLPWEGEESFARLDTAAETRAYIQRFYPDAAALLGDFERDFTEHPVGHLGTVWCDTWRLGGRALLVGDAAHGIVPFFGQGLNCGLEDCAVLGELLDASPQAPAEALFEAFVAARKPNADAIATLALENFVEMRERVGDARFLLRKKLESALERAYPDVYRTRYALIMYTLTPYAAAQAIGQAQEALLASLLEGVESLEEVDLEAARARCVAELGPVMARWGVALAS